MNWPPTFTANPSVWSISLPHANCIHHRHLLLLSPKVDTRFTVQRRVGGWVELGGWLHLPPDTPCKPERRSVIVSEGPGPRNFWNCTVWLYEYLFYSCPSHPSPFPPRLLPHPFSTIPLFHLPPSPYFTLSHPSHPAFYHIRSPPSFPYSTFSLPFPYSTILLAHFCPFLSSLHHLSHFFIAYPLPGVQLPNPPRGLGSAVSSPARPGRAKQSNGLWCILS